MDNAKDLDFIMQICELIEYNNNCWKIPESSGKYWRDELDNNITDSKFKTRSTNNTDNDGTVDVKIRVPLKYVSYIRRTLKKLLVNYEINHILTWPAIGLIFKADRVRSFTITDTKLYAPLVALSSQDNTKLLQQLKLGSNRTIDWKKYQLKHKTNI